LALDELLSLQEGVKGDWAPKGEAPAALAPAGTVSPDELMFIIVHQAFELWFKAILQEVDGALAILLGPEPDVSEAARRLRRVVRIQRLLVEQIHIPATMPPLDFFRFRSQSKEEGGVVYQRGLSPSSGTESYQFREVEIVAGLKGNEAHAEFLQGTDRLPVRFLTPTQERRLSEPSLPEAFEQLLAARGIRDVAEIFAPAAAPNPHAGLADLAEALLEFDEFFRFWRIHHATMVQVMIGERSGTGYLGPEYLRETAGLSQQGEGRVFARSQTRPRFFEPLW
jgi:tryptophan 2,3-dioxygenase